MPRAISRSRPRIISVERNRVITSDIKEIRVADTATLISFIMLMYSQLRSTPHDATSLDNIRHDIQQDVVYECHQYYQRPIGSGQYRSHDYADDAGYEATPGILVVLSASSPFPNFMANIGISLTSNAERMIAKTGMKYHVPQMELIHESGVIST